jgi:EpsI family protein
MRFTPGLRNALAALALMFAAAIAAAVLTPRHYLAEERGAHVDLEHALPAAFGDWQLDERTPIAVVNPQSTELLSRLYEQTLSRVYVDRNGRAVMLAIAYGSDQRDGLALHYPEVCYPAQGHDVTSNHVGAIALPGGQIPVRRLETNFRGGRFEPVTYWTMLGDKLILGGVRKKLVELHYGLRGEIPDGLLFRVSSIGADSPDQFALQDRFVKDLLAAINPEYRLRLAGLQ